MRREICRISLFLPILTAAQNIGEYVPKNQIKPSTNNNNFNQISIQTQTGINAKPGNVIQSQFESANNIGLSSNQLGANANQLGAINAANFDQLGTVTQNPPVLIGTTPNQQNQNQQQPFDTNTQFGPENENQAVLNGVQFQSNSIQSQSALTGTSGFHIVYPPRQV